MKAEIIKRCSVICEVGSIVEISESQYEALGDFCKKADKEITEEKKATKRKSNA